MSLATELGETNLFNAQGAFIATLSMPAPYNQQQGTATDQGPELGWNVSAPGDLNGDGMDDYVAGAPGTNVGTNQDQGVLVVFLAR